jgi:hypothetical protein
MTTLFIYKNTPGQDIIINSLKSSTSYIQYDDNYDFKPKPEERKKTLAFLEDKDSDEE